MAAAATRRQRQLACLVALATFVVFNLHNVVLNYSYGGVVQQTPSAAAQRDPAVDRLVHGLVAVDLGLHGIEKPTEEKLRDYEQYLSSTIKTLQDQIIRDAEDVSTETQLQFLENILERAGDLKSEVQRLRAEWGVVNFFQRFFNWGFFKDEVV